MDSFSVKGNILERITSKYNKEYLMSTSRTNINEYRAVICRDTVRTSIINKRRFKVTGYLILKTCKQGTQSECK